ncbi:hypothetical protein DFP72DRAFT_1057215 [Ephemerocybe angulata]|uniref:J domain-containing protein n=1 Tax=Ephemerocybe angulata TaxID=980116 RepID=A0A8H6IL05_9AGAR|nr:hypothetical protein DFP72DRAFT_1057215 [Tulosesus angulatus]
MQSLLLRASQRAFVVAARAPRTTLPRATVPRQRYLHNTVPRRAQSSTKACPVCTQPLPGPVPACTKCWNIFALPADVSHHELLGLDYDPNPFVVDLPTLKKRFRDAQSICHPDSWASKNPSQKDVAQALSARVNHAYQTLLNPLPRAEYILERNGVHISEVDQAQDMMFMAEIMEARETIDDAENPEEVRALLEENEDKISATVKELESLFKDRDYASAKAATIRLRYLQGIHRAAKRWLDNH